MQVSKANRERIATQAPRQLSPPPRPGATARQRALQFAKSVPKPSSAKIRPAGSRSGRSACGTDAAAAAAAQRADPAGGVPPAGTTPDEAGSTEAGTGSKAAELLDEELGGLTLADVLPASGESK